MGCVFCNISQRAIYGHLLAFAEIPKTESEQKLHDLFNNIWHILYENPALLGLPYYSDESYPWHIINNQYPELDEKFRDVFKGIYEFWHFLQIISLNGELTGNTLFVAKDALKAGKAAYKPVFAPVLEQACFFTEKTKTGVALTHADTDVTAAMQKLSKAAMARASVYEKHYEVNARSLFDFMRCSFDGEWEYMIERIDTEMDMGGALIWLRDECIANGYTLRMHPECTTTSTSGFGIDLIKGVGGFHIAYNPRKTQRFGFGTKNGIGEKKMLENFVALEVDMQRHFMGICRPCNLCMGCTKGGKNKVFTVNLEFEGATHALCPMFPQHEWSAEEFTSELIGRLFRYHELQEIYGK